MSMEKLIGTIIDERSKIGDFETVIRVMWIEMADETELDAIDDLCDIMQRTC
jgi:predicted DNA-binding ribbon-helix-helix protein